MVKELRVSVFVGGPNGDEAQVSDEIASIVESDPGAVTFQAGGACVMFTDRAALMAELAALSSR